MKSSSLVTAALFASLLLSGVMMFRSGGFKPKENEREVLSKWPVEVAKAFEEYDLDKVDSYFVDEFVDQENTPKQTYKSYLAIQKQQGLRYKATLKSTQVEWDPTIPLEAKLQIRFDLVKFDETKPMMVDLELKKIDDLWKGVSAVVQKAILPIGPGIPTTIHDSKSEQPR